MEHETPKTMYTYLGVCPVCGFSQEYHQRTEPERATYRVICAECVKMDRPIERTDTRIY
jgi:hypothetical protein